MSENSTVISYEHLYNWVQKVFVKMGCTPQDAHTATRNLLIADLRGIDSHGVARLSGYVRLWQQQRINTQAKIQVCHETPSTALIDADSGLGLVAAEQAMQLAIQKAQQVGTGWVAVRNSNHFGIAGNYAMMALKQDMIGFAFTNASPLVAPTHSKERMLGTNPIAIAVPADQELPFVADFATTTAANGKLEILQRKQQPTPSGWLQDASGNDTQDAHALKQGGALLPLGSFAETSSHKGFCLGAMVDILSGVLSGANYGPWVPPFVAFLPLAENMPGKGIGHFVGAMRIDAFRPAQEVKQAMDNWIKRFKQAKPIDPLQPVVIPGEPEYQMQQIRFKEGIPLLPPVVADLKLLATQLEVNFVELK